MKKLIIAIALLLAVSCKPQHTIAPGIDKDQRTTITVRDTTIYVRIPGQIVKHFIEVETEKDINTAPSVLQTDYATSISYIRKSKLYHELWQREQEISETIPAAIKEHETISATKETVTVEVNVLTFFQQMWIKIGKLLSGLVGAFIAWQIIKLKLPL